MLLKSNEIVIKVMGNYVCFDGDTLVCKKGILEIKDGIISNILPYDCSRTDVIQLDDNDVIFPGMADLHTHHTYNMIPIWDSHRGKTAWDNRFEWRNCDEYDTNIKKPSKALYDAWHVDIDERGKVKAGDLLLYFAELQAVAGGVTVLQEPSEINIPDNDANVCCAEEFHFTYPWMEDENLMMAYRKKAHMLLRSTGDPYELGIENATNDTEIMSVVDLYKPKTIQRNIKPHIDTSTWDVMEVGWEDLKYYLQNSSKKDTLVDGYIVHLAEGRAGNLRSDGKQVDAYSRKEFENLMTQINELKDKGVINTEDVKNLHINIIHGCGIDLNNSKHLAFIKDNRIGIVWSPVSNLLLYADTPNFYECAEKNGITLTLGSDWSPSGSKHVWDECKVAKKFLRQYTTKKMNINADVFKMVTLNAAKAVGSTKIGDIKKSAFADFFILHGQEKIEESIEKAFDTFYNESDDKMQLVVISGTPVYGEKNYISRFTSDMDTYAIVPTQDVRLKNKMIYLPKEWNLDLQDALKKLDASLEGIKRTQFRSSEDAEYRAQISDLEKQYINPPQHVTVEANQVWNDTQIDINADDVAVIKYESGKCCVSPSTGFQGPLGNGILAKPGYLLEGMSEGCLVGRIADGKPFYIGNEITINNKTGRLYLGVNDDVYGRYGVGYIDNKGQFIIAVTKQ